MKNDPSHKFQNVNDRSHSETCGEVMSGEVKSNEVEERSNKESIDKVLTKVLRGI